MKIVMVILTFPHKIITLKSNPCTSAKFSECREAHCISFSRTIYLLLYEAGQIINVAGTRGALHSSRWRGYPRRMPSGAAA